MGSTPVSMLMFGTLVIALIIAVFVLLRFVRKPSNRHPMDGIRERDVKAGEPPKDGRH